MRFSVSLTEGCVMPRRSAAAVRFSVSPIATRISNCRIVRFMAPRWSIGRAGGLSPPVQLSHRLVLWNNEFPLFDFLNASPPMHQARPWAGLAATDGFGMATQVRIGAAAGFAGDRSDSAGPVIEALAQHDGPRFLIFETLAERTLALAQIDRIANPARGEVPALERLLRPALGDAARHGIRIIGNFGAANPRAAAAKIRSWAAEA